MQKLYLIRFKIVVPRSVDIPWRFLKTYRARTTTAPSTRTFSLGWFELEMSQRSEICHAHIYILYSVYYTTREDIHFSSNIPKERCVARHKTFGLLSDPVLLHRSVKRKIKRLSVFVIVFLVKFSLVPIC